MGMWPTVHFDGDEAWKTHFHIIHHGHGHYLLIEKGKQFSYNMVYYKTKGGARRGAIAAFNKINKEFEKIVLS